MKAMRIIPISIIGLVMAVSMSYGQESRIGSPSAHLDKSKLDDNYPQMKIWAEAGVRGGIPEIESLEIVARVKPGANSRTINAAIERAASKGGGAILLKDGTYDIDEPVKLRSDVYLIGESRENTICIINAGMKDGKAFEFGMRESFSGMYRLTIKGGWLNKNGENKPFYDWNIGSPENNELPDNKVVSVFFAKGSTDCFIDDINIINSADHPMRSHGKYHTIRNVYVDGCFNKQGGCHGYFFLMDSNNLVTGCTITHIRHFSIQGENSAYNVVYDNDLFQEISFHHDDGGNNLIENNRITLPEDMPGEGNPNYYALMGPWSIQHKISRKPNFIYRNKCLEKNAGHDNATPWSDDSVVYEGPNTIKPQDPHTNFLPNGAGAPKAGTLYPVKF